MDGQMDGQTDRRAHTHTELFSTSRPLHGLVSLPEMPSLLLHILKPHLALKETMGHPHFRPSAPSCSLRQFHALKVSLSSLPS